MHCRDLQSVMDSLHVYRGNDLFTFSSTKRKQKKNVVVCRSNASICNESLQSYVIVDSSKTKEMRDSQMQLPKQTDARAIAHSHTHTLTHIHIDDCLMVTKINSDETIKVFV